MHSYRKQLQKHCTEQIERVPDFAGKSGLTLDRHQQDAMFEVAQALDTDDQAFSIVHSCGAGKTILEANLLLASQRAKQVLSLDGKDLIITTERALIHGVRNECMNLGLDVGVWGAGSREIDNHPVVLASIQSLQNNHRHLGRYLPLDETHLLVGDEADKYLTKKRRELLQGFRKAIKVGFTATPSWSDGRDISVLWGRKIHHMPLKEGILEGINVPSYYHLFEASLDDSSLTLSRGDYNKATLAAALKSAEIQKAIPDVYETLVPANQRKKFPTLVFVPSTDLVESVSHDMQARYAHEGVCVRSWTGSTVTTTQMQDDISAFNTGEIDVLVLCDMGGRGLNLPRARCIIDAYSTLSKNKLEQRLSRVMRRVRPGSQLKEEGFEKDFALVAQIIPRSNRFRPCLLPDLLGWEGYQSGKLLGQSTGTMNPGNRDEKSQEELQALKDHIASQNPSHYVNTVKEIDIYRELQLREALPQADSQGFFFLPEGEGDNQKMIKYGTVYAWGKMLSLGEDRIRNRLIGYRGISGRDASGSKRAFYSEDIVTQACDDLLKELPQADELGFFTLTVDGEEKVYGMVHCWAPILNISDITIKKKVKGCEALTARNSKGVIYENAFYEESVVRKHCSDLSDELPRLDEEGFVYLSNKGEKTHESSDFHENERYSSLKNWGRVYGTSYATVKKLMKGVSGIEGKTHRGQKVTLYSESQINHHCRQLLEIPKVDEHGFIYQDSSCEEGQAKIPHATVGTWAIRFNVSYEMLKTRMKGVRGIAGRDGRGRCHDGIFFSEAQIREHCAAVVPDQDGKRFLDTLPRVDEDGFIVLYEEDREMDIQYATRDKWSSHLGLARTTLNRALKPYSGISGLSENGRFVENGFYPEYLVRELCKDYLRGLPRTDKYGFLGASNEAAQEKIGTARAWARTLKTTASRLAKLLKESSSIEGLNSAGKVVPLFSESVVRQTCPYFFDAPRANEQGFFDLPDPNNPGQNIRYGSINAWAKQYGRNCQPLYERLLGVEGRDGIDGRGKYKSTGFYSETVIRNMCADYLGLDVA